MSTVLYISPFLDFGLAAVRPAAWGRPSTAWTAPSSRSGDGCGDALALAVRKTEGVQPWRRVFHMLSGVALAVFVHLAGPGSAVPRGSPASLIPTRAVEPGAPALYAQQ